MTASEETYDVNESFPMLMVTCVKHMRESLNSRFKDSGYSITSEQWIILTHLADQDGISQQDLADRYDRTKVSALNLLKKLENNHFIVRHSDPVDGRCNRVYLTTEGRKLQRSLISLAKTNIVHMSKGLSNEEIELLKSIVRKITGNLKQ